jgi:two-component system chemotaxis response regulator CheB
MTIRVLTVDDSPTMQAFLSRILTSDPEIEIVGAALNASEAREMIRNLNPDVVTLDIEMPGMNGLVFLEKIMSLRPMPVVVVSSMTGDNSTTAILALELGAVDCFPKQTGGKASDHEHHNRDLVSVVKAASKASCSKMSGQVPVEPGVARVGTGTQAAFPQSLAGKSLIAIGASTGGVEALHSLLPHLPEFCPAVVVVQHISSTFTTALADRLNRICRATVRPAEPGLPIEPGHVYIAPGNSHHVNIAMLDKLVFKFSSEDPVSGHRPSIDRMFESVAHTLQGQAAGILLTGMGADGAKGLLTMRNNGGHTIAQDEASSLIYGMPRVAAQLGAAKEILSLSSIAGYLGSQTGKPDAGGVPNTMNRAGQSQAIKLTEIKEIQSEG